MKRPQPWLGLDLAGRRVLALSIAIVVVPFVLFFVFKLRSMVSYITAAMGSVWRDGFTTLERVRYYSPWGSNAQESWGNLHLFCAIYVALALWGAWRRKDPIYPSWLLILGAIAIACFAPLIISHNSDISYSATFLGVMMAVALISIASIARYFPRSGGIAVLLLTAFVALPTSLPLRNSVYHSLVSASNDELRQLAGTYGNIVDAMVQHARRERPHVVVFYDHLFAPHPNIAIKYFHETGNLPAVDRVDSLAANGLNDLLHDADYVLTIVPDPGRATVPRPLSFLSGFARSRWRRRSCPLSWPICVHRRVPHPRRETHLYQRRAQ